LGKRPRKWPFLHGFDTGRRGVVAYNIPIEMRKTVMETIMWALDVVAVVYLCIWALRQDGGLPRKKNKAE
jgi:hypothetical protein